MTMQMLILHYVNGEYNRAFADVASTLCSVHRGESRKKWVVERTIGRPMNFRATRIRCERQPMNYLAMLTLGCALNLCHTAASAHGLPSPASRANQRIGMRSGTPYRLIHSNNGGVNTLAYTVHGSDLEIENIITVHRDVDRTGCGLIGHAVEMNTIR